MMENMMDHIIFSHILPGPPSESAHLSAPRLQGQRQRELSKGAAPREIRKDQRNGWDFNVPRGGFQWWFLWWINGDSMVNLWLMMVNVDQYLYVSGWCYTYSFWKIWLRQLGWWHSEYMGKWNSCSKPPTRYGCLKFFIGAKCIKMSLVCGKTCHNQSIDPPVDLIQWLKIIVLRNWWDHVWPPNSGI